MKLLAGLLLTWAAGAIIGWNLSSLWGLVGVVIYAAAINILRSAIEER